MFNVFMSEQEFFSSFYNLVTIMEKQANILAFSPEITDTLTY